MQLPFHRHARRPHRPRRELLRIALGIIIAGNVIGRHQANGLPHR